MMRSTGSPNTKREILPSSSNNTAFNANVNASTRPMMKNQPRMATTAPKVPYIDDAPLIYWGR